MEENKKKVKTLGKILYVLAIIARVCLGIAAVCLVLCMIVIPIIFSKLEFDKGSLSVNGIKNVDLKIYKDANNELLMMYNGKQENLSNSLDKTELLATQIVFDKLSNTTKEAVVVYIEASIIFSIASLVLLSIAIKNFEEFCKSLGYKDEIFTDDKPEYLKKAGLFLIITYAVSLIAGGALSGALAEELDLNFNTIGIIEILAVYLIAYIFEYAKGLDAKKELVIEEKVVKPTRTRKRKTTKEEK